MKREAARPHESRANAIFDPEMSDDTAMPVPDLGRLLGGLFPEELPARCPRCGGRLLTSIAVYAHVPVKLRIWAGGLHGAPTAHAEHTGRLVETKASLQEQAASDFGRIEEREELYCEHYRPQIEPGAREARRCDYWISTADFEREIEAKVADALKGSLG